MDRLKPVATAPAPCKICGGAAPLYGVVDFNKTCMEVVGVRAPLCGVPVYYRRCPACGFPFTDAFDDWNEDQFKRHIYNSDYGIIDPDYEEKRPRANAETVEQLWGRYKSETRVLDYGGGNDACCRALRASGFPVAVTHDPMEPAYARRPDGKFNLIICFETLEHLPDPVSGIARMLEFADDTAVILYSTLVLPAEFDKHGVGWWYVAPRNGHVSIFSRPALIAVWGRHGYKTASFNDGMHLAFRTLPPFLARLAR
jgi:2-polyprenyl-6-hydroxyphenyl methylase/3-demethylubiquinone-9 3-methyltransferase